MKSVVEEVQEMEMQSIDPSKTIMDAARQRYVAGSSVLTLISLSTFISR